MKPAWRASSRERSAKISATAGLVDFRRRASSLYRRKPENSAVQERSRNSMKILRAGPWMESAAFLKVSLRTKWVLSVGERREGAGWERDEERRVGSGWPRCGGAPFFFFFFDRAPCSCASPSPHPARTWL